MNRSKIKAPLRIRLYITQIPLCLMMICLVSNRVQYGSTYLQKAIGMVLIIVWIASCYVENKSVVLKLLKSDIALLLYFSLLVRFLLMSLSDYGILNSFEYIVGRIAMYIPMLIFSYYYNLFEPRHLRHQTFLALIIWVAIIFCFFMHINFDYTLSRHIVNGTIDRGFFGATIDLLIGTSCIVVTLLSLRKSNKDKSALYYVTVVISIVFFYYQGFITQSAIGVIVGSTGIVLELLFPARKTISMRSLLLGFLLLIVAVWIILFPKTIGDFLLQTAALFHGSIFEERMIEIGKTLVYGSAVGDAAVRLRLYEKSFLTFLRYPIFGSVIRFGYSSSTNDMVGFHSGLDLFARFGLIGSLPLLIGLKRFIKKYTNICPEYKSFGLLSIIILYFFLSNWDHVEGFFAVCYLVPMISYSFLHE